MPERKKLSGASLGCLVLGALGAVGGFGLFLAAVAGGVYLYSRQPAADSVSASSASAPPPMDVATAVGVLRRTAPAPEQARAVVSLEHHAARGDTKAMVMLAACYRAGVGLPRDDRLRAFEWHRKAADAGEPAAMMEMSRYYVEGVWVEADPARARQWLERAAAAGDAEARWALAKGAKP